MHSNEQTDEMSSLSIIELILNRKHRVLENHTRRLVHQEVFKAVLSLRYHARRPCGEQTCRRVHRLADRCLRVERSALSLLAITHSASWVLREPAQRYDPVLSEWHQPGPWVQESLSLCEAFWHRGWLSVACPLPRLRSAR